MRKSKNVAHRANSGLERSILFFCFFQCGALMIAVLSTGAASKPMSSFSQSRMAAFSHPTRVLRDNKSQSASCSFSSVHLRPMMRQVGRTTSLALQSFETEREQEQAQAQQQSPKRKKSFLQVLLNAAIGNGSGENDIQSVQDFDTELANEIQEALLSAGLNENGNGMHLKTEVVLNGATNSIDSAVSANKSEAGSSFKRKIIRPTDVKSTPRRVENESPLPPHTSLAQVLANQNGIDLRSVTPQSQTPGAKITASDVEYHMYKISQPPCTPEALQLAYSLGLDLKDLYENDNDEEDDNIHDNAEKYVLKVEDVQLYQENMRSLQLSSQSKKHKASKKGNDTAEQSTKQTTKKSALDLRMEKNMEQLSRKAGKVVGTVAEGIVQQAQQVKGRVGKTIAELNSSVGGSVEGSNEDVQVKSVSDSVGRSSKSEVDGSKETNSSSSSGESAGVPSSLFFANLK